MSNVKTLTKGDYDTGKTNCLQCETFEILLCSRIITDIDSRLFLETVEDHLFNRSYPKFL